MEFYYVDTAASAGGNGENRTHDTGSYAFDSLANAEAHLDLDATYDSGLVDDMTIKCAGGVDDTAVVWNAFGSDATYTLTIMGDDGADDSLVTVGADDGTAYDNDGRYTGPLDWSTSHYRLDVTGATAFQAASPMDFIGLQVTRSDAFSNGTSAYFVIGTSGDVTVDSCRFWCGAGGSQKPFYFKPTNQSSTTWTVQNCISANPAAGNSSCLLLVTASSNTMTVNFHNNTLIGADSGTTLSRGVWLSGDGTGSTISVRNNVILGGPTQDLDDDLTGTPTTTTDNNASASGVGTNAITITTETDEVVDPTGTAPGNFDFTPKNTGQLSRAGDPTYAPSLDINGTARNAYLPDVGAIERIIQTDYLYVDTEANAGGNGTTRAHSSGDNTHAFDSLYIAEATIDNSPGLNDHLIIKCAGNTTVDDNYTQWIGTGSTAAYTLTIMGDDGADDSPDGGDDAADYDNDGRYTGPLDWSTSHYRMEVDNYRCLMLYFAADVIGLQFRNINTTLSSQTLRWGRHNDIAAAPEGVSTLVDSCRVWCPDNDYDYGIYMDTDEMEHSSCTITIQNNIVLGSDFLSRGITWYVRGGQAGTLKTINNTVYGIPTESMGIRHVEASTSTCPIIVANNAVGNMGDDWVESGTLSVTYSYNASEDADEGGNAITLGTHTNEWVDPTGSAPGNYDLTPLTTGSLYQAGDATYAPTLDIHGQTRNSLKPSVGAVEGPGPDTTTGVEFDGSVDFYKNSTMAGSADGRKGTLAAILKFDQTVGDFEQIFGFSCSFARTATGEFRVRANSTGGTKRLQIESSTTLTTGTWYRILASWDLTSGSSKARLYIDGVDVKTTDTLNDTADIDYTKTDEIVGAASDTPDSPFEGCIGEFWFSQTEFVEFDTEANRLVFFDSLGNVVDKGPDGSTPTGTAPIIYLSGGIDQFGINFGSGSDFVEDAGSSTVVCTLPIASAVAPGVDSLSISGKAPTADLVEVFTTQPGVDSLSISGKAPTADLVEVFTTQPGVDSLSISGKAPTADLVEVFTTQPGVDSLSISGKAPTADLVEVFTTQPGVDSLSISGKAPTADLVEVFTTQPGVDSLSISGKAPTANLVEVFTTQPGVDSLSISGKAPTANLVEVFTTQPGVDSLSISGKAPTASLGLVLTATPGVDNLSISGKAPTADLVEVFTTQPGVDNLAISGKAPTASLGLVFTTQPGVDSLSISGKAPTASLSLRFTTQPGVDSLSISGKASTVDLIIGSQTFTATPGVDNLAISGKAPTISVGESLVGTGSFTITSGATTHTTQPGVDNLAISGKAPTANLVEVFTTQPGVDSLSISGKAPTASLSLRFTTQPGVDSLSISGKAPTADLVEVFTTQPGVDSLSISGKAPTADLVEVFTTQPGVDSLSISGKAPTASLGEITTAQPGVDNLAISGKAPTANLVEVFTTQPGVDNLAISGKAPTVSLGLVFTATPGVDSLSISGKAPIATLGEITTAQPGADNLAISGKAPTVDLIEIFTTQPGVDSLTISGKAPTASLRLVFTTEPGVDNLAIAGKAPSSALSTTFTTEPGVDSLTLTGKAPSVELDLVFTPTPGTDDLTISGKAPIASLNLVFVTTPGTDHLTATGKVPTLGGVSLVQGSAFISLREPDSAQLLTVSQTAELLTVPQMAEPIRQQEATSRLTKRVG